ncbi:MAG: SDR family NAD(P)-dependent oxidoreductase, partial [Polyangiaceae bacterium]
MSAVVTGAGSGIGRAIALALASRGLPVALLGRTAESLEGTLDAIERMKAHAIAVPCDV